MRKCHKCGHAFDDDYKTGFRDSCPGCHAYVHACLNCAFYDPNAHNHCREPTADYVADAEGQNYCGQFTLTGREAAPDGTAEAKRNLNNLFDE